MLVRLLYASRAATAVTTDMVESILQQSRANNPALGLTGVLCHGGEIFMQVLEGGRDAVNAMYNRIARDSRHHTVTLLQYLEIGERHFSGWTMGHVNLAKLNPSILLKYSDKPTLDPYHVPGRASMALLDELIATAQIIGRT
jgi:hypothetical protein